MIGKTILVTGAAKRVGRSIVRELHAAGANVAIHFRSDREAALELVAELSELRADSAQAFAADLVDTQAPIALVDAVLAHFGRLDGLVNNASSFFPTPIGTIDEATWTDLIGSNLKAPLFLIQAAAPHLAQRHGAVVNITDVHAERPLAGYPVYCAAKAGLLGLTRALAIELAPAVRVNAVAPGAILWPETESSGFPAVEREQIVAHTLLKRCGAPHDIARAVRFLLDEATYVTGQVLNVDGGRTAHL